MTGFVPLLIVLIFGTAIFYFLWQFILYAYPDYQDILQGFTYNGHDYMLMFYCFGLAFCFIVYKNYSNPKFLVNYLVAPLVVWLIILLLFNIYLPGAGFLIVPFFCGLLSFVLLIFEVKKWWLHLIFLSPGLVLMYTLMNSFAIGLGLKMLFLSNFLLFLTFLLMYGVFGQFKRKGFLASIFLFIGLAFMFKAHKNSDFQEHKARPNSLLYVIDGNQNKAYWATYNKILDPWLQNYLSKKDTTEKGLNNYVGSSKYNSGYSYAKQTSYKAFDMPEILIKKDTIKNNFRYLSFEVLPNRPIQRLDVLVSDEIQVFDLVANGCKTANQKESLIKKRGQTLISYYPTDSTNLELSFRINKNQVFEFELQSSSFDLLENPNFSIPKRPNHMMPMPFVLTDAILTKKTFKL